MTVDARAVLAANNNADWYEVMFQAHGLRYGRRSFAFVGQDRPPPYYSNLTVLLPNHVEEVVSELARSAERFGGALGLKDSFCQLSLAQNGFETRFAACWIWREAQPAGMPDGWHVVENDRQLTFWEQAWKANGSPADRRMFPDSLLERSEVFFLGQEVGGRYVAGSIANLSDTCIGLSNVFSEAPSVDVYAHAANAAAAMDITRPLVGYEAGDDLAFATSRGFEVVGDLRVLVAKDARF